MATDTQKKQYCQSMQSLMTDIGRIVDRIDGFTQAYTDRGYDTAAADPVTNTQLADFGVVQYDLGAAINALQQISALFKGQATVTSAAYRAAMNKWRSV